MRKLRRGLELSIVAATMALVAAAPAGALAAGGESGSGSTPGETVTESPGDPTEPATPAAPSTGWTPQGAGTVTSSDGAAQIRRGSSLGSGGGPKQAGSTSEEQAGSTSEEPSYTTGSSGYYEPKSLTPSTFEEPASTPPAGSGIGSVERPATAATTGKAVSVAVGAATAVTGSESPQGGNISSAPPALAASLTEPRDQVASGSDSLPLGVVIVLGLILVSAGGLGVRRWRGSRQRRRLEALWHRQEAEWEAVVRQIQLERAAGASKPSGKRLPRVDLGSDFAVHKARNGGGPSQGPRRAKGKPAKAK